MEDGSVIWMYIDQRGGKPAIFLMTPTRIPDLRVTVDLNKDWKLTALYPPMVDKESL